MMTDPKKRTHIAAAAQMAVAACSMALVSGREIQLLPAGVFRAYDGRPTEAPGWRLDASLAQKLVAAATARATPYVIDYEHQTLRSEKNGQPAPAAGWFNKLEWRDGEGLFAVDVEWTAAAQAMIDSKEYRFISPVIAYDASGAVTGLLMAAVTNNPAIGGMDEVLLAAASAQYASQQPTPTKESSRDELLKQLRSLLNLSATSTTEEIMSKLKDLTSAVTPPGQDAQAAASCDVLAFITAQRTMIASLSSITPDPAKFVAIGTMQALQGQVAQLSGELNKARLDGLIKSALDGGKLLPAMEGWAREYGAKDLAALSSYVDNAPPIALLAGTQTQGKPPASLPAAGGLTDSQVALCAAMGVSETDFKATLLAEQPR